MYCTCENDLLLNSVSTTICFCFLHYCRWNRPYTLSLVKSNCCVSYMWKQHVWSTVVGWEKGELCCYCAVKCLVFWRLTMGIQISSVCFWNPGSITALSVVRLIGFYVPSHICHYHSNCQRGLKRVMFETPEYNLLMGAQGVYLIPNIPESNNMYGSFRSCGSAWKKESPTAHEWLSNSCKVIY